MIFKNVGTYNLMVVTKWSASMGGGPAVLDTTYSIRPGEYIDLSILGLEPMGRKMTPKQTKINKKSPKKQKRIAKKIKRKKRGK